MATTAENMLCECASCASRVSVLCVCEMCICFVHALAALGAPEELPQAAVAAAISEATPKPDEIIMQHAGLSAYVLPACGMLTVARLSAGLSGSLLGE